MKFWDEYRPGDLVHRVINGRPVVTTVITIIRLRDHEPVDGPFCRNVVAELSDGTWEFLWNLREQEGDK